MIQPRLRNFTREGAKHWQSTRDGTLSPERVRGQLGYTLIEILIVIFIISIVSGVALLSIGHNQNKQVEYFANQLSQTITLVQEQAILESSVFGLSFNQYQYQFMNYKADTPKDKNPWVPLKNDRLLGKKMIPTHLEVQLELAKQRINFDEEELANSPQIIISPNGDITPFLITIGRKSSKPSYAIVGNENGRITTKCLS